MPGNDFPSARCPGRREWKVENSYPDCNGIGKQALYGNPGAIPNLTSCMLSKELKELEMNRLIERKVYDSIPVVIEYTVTEHGRTLNTLIEELRRWGVFHRGVITGSDQATPK